MQGDTGAERGLGVKGDFEELLLLVFFLTTL